MIAPGDIESIERATLAGLGCDPVDELSGWLLPRVKAPMGRAKSAVPLTHDGFAGREILEDISARYGADGFEPVFRMPDAPGMGQVRNLLAGLGFAPDMRPTRVMIADLDDVACFTELEATFGQSADSDWAAVFAGPGFDPEEGAQRIRVLASARNTLFGRVTRDGAAAAVGVGNFNYGWVSIHGMRTAEAFRGQGLAGAILAGLARIGLEREFTRAVLQVEEGNSSALNLYRRAGFATLWRYDYWRR